MEQDNKQEQNQENQEQELKKQISRLDKVKKNLYSKIHEFDKDQQELIKKLDDIEEVKKANYKNYLEGFDEEFETHTQDIV